MKIIALLFLLAATAFAHSKGCIHDTLDVKLQYAEEDSSDHVAADSQNRVLADTYQNMRIVADYTYLTKGDAEVREYIQNELMPSAISYFQSALKIIRSTSNIRFGGTCDDYEAPSILTTTGYAADLVILVTGSEDDEQYLAYALACGLSRTNDRPVYGSIHFNLKYMPMDSVVDREENLINTLHELTHVLGFSAQLYELYINPTTGAKINPIGEKVINGQTVPYINAEPVKSKVRAYFDCDTVEGAYLENQGDSGSAGSHFERRVFGNEGMTANSITDSVTSELTLAVLESTGWYKPSYSASEPFTWGKGKGCNFLNGLCMTGPTSPTADVFCAPLQTQGCTFTARAAGFCGATRLNQDPDLPAAFNYFGNSISVSDPFSDNCPYYLGYLDYDCENPANQANAFLDTETFSTTSRCFAGTLSAGASPITRTGYCFKTECSTNNGVPVVSITIGSNKITCTAAGTKTVPDYAGTLECPDPAKFCAASNPVYCHRGCSGRGKCTNGKCICPDGWTGDDCGRRAHGSQCARCASNTNAVYCYGDGCSCGADAQTCSAIKNFGNIIALLAIALFSLIL